MKILRFKILFFLIASCACLTAQNINPNNIEIVRDKWGVPHIFAKTDAEAAYGLAWAHAEDDFQSIQEAFLSGKNLYGAYKGKDGVIFDYALQYTGLDTLVDKLYETSFSDEFKKVLKGYAQGINDFAGKFPREVLIKKAFPITEQDIIRGYCVKLTLMAGLGLSLKAINDNQLKQILAISETGSNALVFDPSRTEDGQTWLVGNSHQPMDGPLGWYEAHVQSEEGWNILGGLFPGGVSIFLGTTPNLAWTHTVNYNTWGDVYKMEINPKNKNQYKYDGEWKDFEIRKAKLKIKLFGFVKLPVKKKLYSSLHGPVFKSKQGDMYATKYPAYNEIRYAEQWWRLNKATNFEEFENTLKMQSFPMFNVLYADKEGNIFFLSDGHYPVRNPYLNWSGLLPGNTSLLNWQKLHTYDFKPRYLNPTCGYLFNSNNTPLVATCSKDTTNVKIFIGLQQFMYNRGDRFEYLLENHQGIFTWQDILDYKYDKKYQSDKTYMKNFQVFYQLNETKYPKLAEIIQIFKNWDLDGNEQSYGATISLLTTYYLNKKHKANMGLHMIKKEPFSEQDAVEALQFAKDFLLKYHGSIYTPLSKVQRHIRGNKSYAVGGLSEVPRAIDASLFDADKGIFKAKSGDGYIQFAKFNKSGLTSLETVHAYGASSRKNSIHYTDQMQMFVKEETKTMSLDKEKIYSEAKAIYTPFQMMQLKKNWYKVY